MNRPARAALSSALTVVLLVTNSAVRAQSTEPSAPPSTRHKHPAGASFDVPAGWKVVDQPMSAVLIPPGGRGNQSSATVSESYTIGGSVDSRDPGDPAVSRELQTSLASSGMQSVRESGKEKFRAASGDGVLYTIDGTNGQTGKLVRVRAYLIPVPGVMLFVVAAGEVALVDRRDPDVRQVAMSLKYDPATASPAADGSGAPGGKGVTDGLPQSEEWRQRLANQYLLRMEFYNSGGDGGGYSSSKRWHLAGDGTFQYSGSSSLSVNVDGASGGSNGQTKDSGRWRLATEGRTTYLVLNYADGQSSRWGLEDRQGQTWVNGRQLFVTPTPE